MSRRYERRTPVGLRAKQIHVNVEIKVVDAGGIQ
jgi:hypothetical protein